MQDADSLPPPFRPAERLDEKAGGSCIQRRKTPSHDIIDIEHLSIVATAHT